MFLKIVEMHIYGFGQLEDMVIKDLKEFQVFYGENEAGKSTLTAFIHAVLFGFPTKQQAELRYEPKQQAKYGGKLKVYHPDRGYAVIERVKGKAAGNVTVTLSDGTRGGEALLKELLSNIDKSIFQSIFSFSLHGLQNIHQMKKEDFGKFLFSAGTVGTERLALAENELQKELDGRFKPNGKKPVLNEKMHELHQMSAELKKAAQKNLEYEQLMLSRENFESELSDLEHSLSHFRQRESKLKEWQKLKPIVSEIKNIERELEGMNPNPFPLNGIGRLEKLLMLLNPKEAQIGSSKERLQQTHVDLQLLSPNSELLAHESDILATIEKLPIYEQLRIEEKQLEVKVSDLKERLSVMKEQLHLPITEQGILEINTNIFMKQQVEEIHLQQQKLTHMKQELDERFQEEKYELESIEEEINQCQQQLLPDETRAKLEAKFDEASNLKTAEAKLNLVKEKIVFLEQTQAHEKQREKEHKKQKQTQFSIIFFVILMFVFYGAYNQEWLFVGIGAVCGLVILLLSMIGNSRSPEKETDAQKALKELRNQEVMLQAKLEVFQNEKDTSLQDDLITDDRLKDNIKQLNIKLKYQNSQYEKVISKFESWEADSIKQEQHLLDISKQLSLPAYIASTHLLEGFQLIEQFKSLLREKHRINERLQSIKAEAGEIYSRTEQFALLYLPEISFDIQRSSFLLKRKLKEETEKQIQYKEKKVKYQELEAVIQQLNSEQKHLRHEISNLLEQAMAESEEEYYDLGRKSEKRERLLDKLDELKSQKNYSFLKAEDVLTLIPLEDVEAETLEVDAMMKSIQKKIPHVQSLCAEVKYEIQRLEEGGLYSDLLHTYKQKKYELEEEAKAWAAYCLAQEILARTVEKYKNERLPRMLTKAEDYLHYLTDGNYRRIHLKETGTGFLIEKENHIFFEANELSQATMEQVYVSLRLALVVTLYEKYRFPIMIDDSFVNFDHNRTAKVMELLRGLGENQVLFFTCHSHMLTFFDKSDILCLERGKVKVK